MSIRNKHPGSAFQRATGAEKELQMAPNSQTQAYATCSELQRRHVMQRCGIARRHACLIAGLLFGEDSK